MRKVLFLLVLILLAGSFTFNFAKQKVKKDLSSPIPYPTTTITPSVNPDDAATGPEKTSLFVPYWTVKNKNYEEGDYNSYIYFGVVPTKEGIDTKEQGSLTLDTFLSSVPADGKKLLALRMIERDTNFAILKDQDAQKKIIAETMALAKEKKFDGVVLDLEISAIPFESLVSQINSFTELFYKEAKRNDLSFSLAVYGDVFYRVRPFDVKTLAKHTDNVMIMAYDFSKAKGNPGPNFPLQGEDVYGYDYALLTKDFLKFVPPEKITIIFGLFGYDWVVDGQGRTLQQGKALSTREIESGFIENCQQRSCSFSRDTKAFETQVNYVGKDGSKHIIWFEDMQSVEAKKEYLKSRGINSFSYWAHSYF
jgi:spore germination protein YaaH